jgi:apolipoprotein N-acyltransferase
MRVKKYDFLLAALSGLLLIISFAPYDFYYVAWCALVPFFISLWGKSGKRALLLGLTMGFVYFLGTTYWVYNSLYNYGHLPFVVSILMVGLLNLYLAFYVGLFSFVFSSLLSKSKFPAVILAPPLWVTLEILRTYVFTGFPWSILGYSQYTFLPFIQIADITGVYGLSFLVVSFNGALTDILFLPKKRREAPLFSLSYSIAGLILLCLSLGATFYYGHLTLQRTISSKTLKVSVIQGNIDQDKKWDRRFEKEIIDTYKRLTTEADRKSPDLIVWPENALPFVFEYDKNKTEALINFQKKLDTYLLLGSDMIKEIKDKKIYFSNSAILIGPDGSVISIYDKIHLVPFGEYLPLKWLFPFIDKLVVTVGEFITGDDFMVMETSFGKISTVICYEIIFPGLVRKFVNSGAQMIVTITNDAWFGDSPAPYQHFSMAVFRAIENRVPLARAANTGISGFIDAQGRIIQKSDIFEEAALTQKLTITNTKKSFYTKYGDLFTFLCVIATILLVAEHFFNMRLSD